MKLYYPWGLPPEGTDAVYRVEANSYSYCVDLDREKYASTSPRLELYWYEVEKRTPKGYWIGDRWINSSWSKRYAAPDIPAALEDFRCRKRRQIRIYTGKLARAEMELNRATESFIDDPLPYR